MKRSASAALAVALLVWVSLHPARAQVLLLSELGTGDEVVQVLDHTQRPNIVDINNQVRIVINLDSVRQAAKSFTGTELDVSADSLRAITNVLNQQTRVLGLLSPTPGNTREQERQQVQTFGSHAHTALDAGLPFDSLGIDTTAASVIQLRQLSTTLHQATRQTTKALQSAKARGAVYFRLAGWIRSSDGALRPVHIPNFDNLQTDEFFQVSRFNIPSSATVQLELQAATQAANAYNAEGFSAALDGVKQRLQWIADSVEVAVSCFEQRLDATVAQDAQPLFVAQDTLTDLRAQADMVIQDARAIEQLVGGGGTINVLQTDAKTLLGQAQTLLQSLKDDLPFFQQQFASLKSLVENLPSAARTVGQQFIGDAEGCIGPIQNEEQHIAAELDALAHFFALSPDTQVQANLDFSSQVSPFLISQIPAETTLDLRQTGQRAEGDELLLKVGLEWVSPDSTVAPVRQPLAVRPVVMYLIGWHGSFSVLPIFADPTSKGDVTLTRQFQAVPAYSLLLKRGSRSSVRYNEFWNVGIGLNVAAPDFNLDSTPEIGLGLVASTARDYAQLGFARNLNADAWYWFFGIRLPFGLFSTPGVSTN